MSIRKRLREGKTQGGVKDLPDGPRPNIGPPPPQHVPPPHRLEERSADKVDLSESISYLMHYGGSFNVRKDKHARYQFVIPGLVSVQYSTIYKTCKEFVSTMAKIGDGVS